MNKPDNTRKVLGKGLSALLPTRPPVAPPAEPSPEITHTVGIDQIDANPLQPRRLFQQERLAELAHCKGIELADRTADGIAVVGMFLLNGQHATSQGTRPARARAGCPLRTECGEDATRFGAEVPFAGARPVDRYRFPSRL